MGWFRDLYKELYQGEVLNDEELVDKNKKWENYLTQKDNLKSLHKKVNEKISKNNNKEDIEIKIIDEEIAYLKINSFAEFTKEDTDKINELYKDINNYNDYIIDIRGNGGGNNRLWMEHIVNPIVFTLPNSGLVVRTTAEKGLNKDGSSNLENVTSLDLYMNSLDDLIEYIKNKN